MRTASDSKRSLVRRFGAAAAIPTRSARRNFITLTCPNSRPGRCLTANAAPRWMMTHICDRPARKDRGIVVAMPGPNVARDIRLSGFGDRAPLSTAWTWLEVWSAPSSPEIVPIAEATGRVLAESITASIDLPDLPRAAENGYAVRSSDCYGANAYNPLLLSLLEPGTDGLAPGFACLITSGLALPSGADAVLPFEAAQTASPRSLEVLAPVASGTGIDHASPAANIVLERGRLIGPRDVGCSAAMGVERVAVVCRPRVALVVPGRNPVLTLP